MPLPKGTKLRRGDIVALHLAVKYDMSGDDYVHLDVASYAGGIASFSDIAYIVRRVFHPGERVKVVDQGSRHYGKVATVEALSKDGAMLWCHEDSVGYVTLGADEVELVDDGLAVEAAQ